jgi:hypothetical protein
MLLDTSFFLRLLNEKDPLYTNANGYFQYFVAQEVPMMLSTIAVAEYCVRGSIEELPLRNLRIIPFNLSHAKRAGEFAGTVFQHKGLLELPNRKIIPNDAKLFAQADVEPSIGYYLTSDVEALKIFNLLKVQCQTKFQFIDINTKHTEVFGLLDF